MSAIAPATAGPVSFVRRRPLISFFLWFFTVGQAFAFVPVLVDVPYPQVFINLSTVVGLLLPALVITRVVDGPEALRALLRSSFAWRTAPRWYLLALVLVPALALVLALVASGTPTSGASWWTALVPGFALQLVLTFVLNNWWEEVAWAGFVQVRLQNHFDSTVRAGLVAGPLFALQHVSLVVDMGPVAGGLALAALAVVATPYRMLNGWMVNRGASLFVVGLLHAAGDAAGPGSGFGEGMLGVLYGPTSTSHSIHVLGIALIGLVVLAATRGRLGHRRDPLARPVHA